MNFRVLPVVFLASACVTTSTHEKKLAEAEALRASQQKTADEQKAELEKKLGALEEQLASVNKELEQSRATTTDVTGQRDALRKQLDDQTAVVGELKKRLEKLGQNVEKLMSEKGALAQGLEDSKHRLEELRKQREAAEQRLATFKKLVDKLQSMISANQLKVVVRNGRMVLSLPDAVLFDSGKTDLKPEGASTLGKIAEVLAGMSDRHFLVAGHTDDVPIKTPRFPSNWDLSASRAVEVVNHLIKQGMKPQALAAAGYGEFDPVVPNDSPEHKAQNRRIEIVLQPNLAELPSLEGITQKN